MLTLPELDALAAGIDLLIKREGADALRNGHMAVYASGLRKLQAMADEAAKLDESAHQRGEASEGDTSQDKK